MTWHHSPEQMLDEIQEAAAIAPHSGGTALSSWEAEFCESLRDQLDQGRRLTDRQLSKLREIYDR